MGEDDHAKATDAGVYTLVVSLASLGLHQASALTLDPRASVSEWEAHTATLCHRWGSTEPLTGSFLPSGWYGALRAVSCACAPAKLAHQPPAHSVEKSCAD